MFALPSTLMRCSLLFIARRNGSLFFEIKFVRRRHAQSETGVLSSTATVSLDTDLFRARRNGDVIFHTSPLTTTRFDLRAPSSGTGLACTSSLCSSRSTRDVQIAVAPRDEFALSPLAAGNARSVEALCKRRDVHDWIHLSADDWDTSWWTQWGLLDVVVLRKEAVK